MKVRAPVSLMQREQLLFSRSGRVCIALPRTASRAAYALSENGEGEPGVLEKQNRPASKVAVTGGNLIKACSGRVNSAQTRGAADCVLRRGFDRIKKAV